MWQRLMLQCCTERGTLLSNHVARGVNCLTSEFQYKEGVCVCMDNERYTVTIYVRKQLVNSYHGNSFCRLRHGGDACSNFTGRV